MREADRLALIKLLADDDPTVLRLLAERFAEMGVEGRDFLTGLLAIPDTGAHHGAKEILRSLAERDAGEAFARFCATCRSPTDLAQGCWLLAKTRYPDCDMIPYAARVVDLAQELRERLTGSETPRGTIEVINRHLFATLGFRGNQRDYYDPDNSYLNRVLDRRLGIPISLSALYLLLAQRLRLPVHGVNLPGHFVVQWKSPTTRFFIDPFNEGRILTEADCRGYCTQIEVEWDPRLLDEPSTRQVLARMCQNLQAVYTEGDLPRASRLQGFIALLSRA